MPTEPQDLARRVDLCKAEDRVRGMMFNELLALVERHLGPEGVARVREVLPPDARYRDLLSYPITDFMKLMYRAADLLEEKLGGVEPAIRACGAATVEAFSRTTAGALFFSVLSVAGPAQLLKGAQTAYRSVVTYCTRDFTPVGEAGGTRRMQGDMPPLAYPTRACCRRCSPRSATTRPCAGEHTAASTAPRTTSPGASARTRRDQAGGLTPALASRKSLE